MVISDTFCWRISKENGWYIVGCLDLVLAIGINMAIIQSYMYGNVDELTELCRSHGTHSNGENLNCPPAEVNRTIMYLLAFIVFACNFLIFLHPFSSLHAYKTKTPEVLVSQIISGIIKLMCIFVYAVLAALFLPMRALILFFVIVFEHYKIRHTLYLYIQLKNLKDFDFVDRLRLEAGKQMSRLQAIEPPSYDEAISRNPRPVSSTEHQDTEQSTMIPISSTALQDTEQSTKIDVPTTIPFSATAPQDTEQSARIDVPTTMPVNSTAPQDTEQSTRIGVPTTMPVNSTAPQDTEQSARIGVATTSTASHDTEQSIRIGVSTWIPVSSIRPQDTEQSSRIDVPVSHNSTAP